MKKIITITCAMLFGAALFGAETASIAERAVALKASAESALEGKKSSAAKSAVLAVWLPANADEINAVCASVSEVPQNIQATLATWKGLLDNGTTATTWTLSLPLIQQYAPSIYIRYAATEAELNAHIAGDSPDTVSVQVAVRRLGLPDTWLAAYWQSRLARGESSKLYQRWFKQTYFTLPAAERLPILVAEREALMQADQSTGRDLWLRELLTEESLSQ